MSATRYYTPDRIASNAMQTFYMTFPFGSRHIIGDELVPMWDRWVEVRARSKPVAYKLAAVRFGMEGWQMNGEDGFPPDRRAFYPQGCCLILINSED